MAELVHALVLIATFHFLSSVCVCTVLHFMYCGSNSTFECYQVVLACGIQVDIEIDERLEHDTILKKSTNLAACVNYVDKYMSMYSFYIYLHL